jgi:hypothetical protein
VPLKNIVIVHRPLKKLAPLINPTALDFFIADAIPSVRRMNSAVRALLQVVPGTYMDRITSGL